MPDALESKSARELAMVVINALYLYGSRSVATEALLELLLRVQPPTQSMAVERRERALLQWQEAQHRG